MDTAILTHRLRSIANAYPEDIFGPVTEEEQKEHASLITRNSAAMGRHLGQFLIEAADAIDQLATAISDATSRAEMAEAEAHRTHMEVRADYDKTVADAWRAAVAKEREYAETRLDALESLKELLAKQIMGFPGYAQCAACGTSWGVGMPEEHEKSCPVDLGLKIIEAALSESENEKG